MNASKGECTGAIHGLTLYHPLNLLDDMMAILCTVLPEAISFVLSLNFIHQPDINHNSMLFQLQGAASQSRVALSLVNHLFNAVLGCLCHGSRHLNLV